MSIQTAYAASAKEVAKNLAIEQKKAQERRSSLDRLTAEEKKLDSTIAATETRVLAIEKTLAEKQAELASLLGQDVDAQKEFDTLVAEQKETEAAQNEVMLLLWDVMCKQESGGSQGKEWAILEQDYSWSCLLFTSLDMYKTQLEEQKKKIEAVLERRNSLATAMENAIAAANAEKTKLLTARLTYDQQLKALRKRKVTLEEELTDILKIVDSLNLQMKEFDGVITTLKGSMPWPASGSVKKRFSASGKGTDRGLSIATSEKATVHAVADGKVVHNDILRGFGTVLILQHGKEYYSLYAFLGKSPLKVGADVKMRDSIGTVGFFPDIKGSGVYFELRFRQKAINPEKWLAPA